MLGCAFDNFSLQLPVASLKTCEECIILFQNLFLCRRSQAPYNMTVAWDFPIGAGSIEIDVTQISFNKVEGKVSLLLGKQTGSYTSYMMDLDLSSGPTLDLIDVGGSVKFKSNHDYWE